MRKHIQKLLCCILCFAMLLSCCPVYAFAEMADREGNDNYYTNQGELQDSAFAQLPLSAVQAKDWLLEQLLMQKYGLTGGMQDYHGSCTPNNGWRGGSGDNWERGPYYARGLIDTAFALDDPELMEQAMLWIDFCLESQRENGFFGPINDGDGYSGSWDWWPRMIMLSAIRDYYEYTEYKGEPDERVMPFFENYFRFQHERLPNYPLVKWAMGRAGDNAEVVLWYYNRVYDPANPEASQWLIELAEELLGNCRGFYGSSEDWITIYTDTTVRNHVVNTTQAMKTPAVQWQITGTDRDRNAIREGLFNLGIDHGRVDGLANSDEFARDNNPYVGAETCSVVESIQSYGIAMRILGDSWLGDDMERLAYNNLPSCYTPNFTAQCYFQAQNQLLATNGSHEFYHDHNNSSAFGYPSGDYCCLTNMHIGWAKFIQNMWMATSDNGLAVIAYGPNAVTAQVADGKTAVFDQNTKYPFDGDIVLDYSGETASFPLMLRVPEWCTAPVFKVNGQTMALQVVNGYVTIDREWTAGDYVQIDFPMEIELSTWYNNSTAVMRGPVIYTVKIEEDWHTRNPGALYPSREVTPASTWNYALVYDKEDIQNSFAVTVVDKIDPQPFVLSSAPVTIKATGQIVPQWQLLNNVVQEPPYSPIAEDLTLQEEIELIPYGCSRLNIIQMPWVGQIDAGKSTRYEAEDGAVTSPAKVRPNSTTASGNECVVSMDNANASVTFTVEVPTAGEYEMIATVDGHKNFPNSSHKYYINGNTADAKIINYPNPTATAWMVWRQFSTTVELKAGTNTITFTHSGKDKSNTDIDCIDIVEPGGIVVRTADEAETGILDGRKVMEFDNVVVPNADNYTLKIHYTGSGSLDLNINSKYEQSVEFAEGASPYVLEDLVGLLPEQWDVKLETYVKAFQFGYGQYNNIRLFGESGVTIESIEVIPQGKLQAPEITVAESDDHSVTLSTNVERADGFYQILYGTESGKYTVTASGFRTQNAQITGLVAGQTYYFKLSMLLDGVTVESNEVSVTLDNAADAEPPKAEFYDDFSDPEVSAANWSVSGNEGVVTFEEGAMLIAADKNIKAFAGDESWTDYVVEATLRSNTTTSGDYGIAIRATNVDESDTTSTNGYDGYYVGLMNGYIQVGYMDQNWHYMNKVACDITSNQDYNLKVIVCGAKITIYVDGEEVYQFTDNRYSSGKVGVRSYNKEFEVSSFRVRNLTEEEVQQVGEYVITQSNYIDTKFTYSFIDGVQLAYSGISGTPKIAYGTESGVYDHEVYELNHKFSSDKASVSGMEAGKTYYVRIMNNSGNNVSQEITVTPGTRPNLTGYDTELKALLAEAQTAQQENYTEEAWLRLEQAVAYAEKVLALDYANEMDVDLAESVLTIATNETGYDNRPAVTSVAQAMGLGVSKNTAASAIENMLPKTVKVTCGDEVFAANVRKWSCDDYDMTKVGEYVFCGKLAPSANFVNTNDLTAEAIVTVHNRITRYEAEDAVLTGLAAVRSNTTNASGNACVKTIDNADSTVTFTVEVPVDGEYEMLVTVDGHVNWPNSSHKCYVNGDVDSAVIIDYPKPTATSWLVWRQVSTTVELKAGTNTITLAYSGKELSNCTLDCIDIVEPEGLVSDVVTRYEAEDGVITSPAKVKVNAGSSGGECVVSMDNANASVTFTVDAPADGKYDMIITVDGHASYPNTSHKYYINGNKDAAVLIDYPNPTATQWMVWRQFTTSVELKAGTNTITFTHSGKDKSFADIDCIDIVQRISKCALVEQLIDAIGEVTLDSGEAINAAREAYDALSQDQKDAVANAQVLVKAECDYAVLVSGENAEDAKSAAEAAKAAQAAAEEAQAAAEAARDEAVTAKTAAEAAQAEAETAQAAAEEAQAKAETAQKAAEEAAANAGEDAEAAEAAQKAAETAKEQAVAAQNKAEKAGADALTAQSNAETAEANAETAEANAKTAQSKAEEAAKAAENSNLKAAEEAAKAAQEAAKAATESGKAAAEAAKAAKSASDAAASATAAAKSAGESATSAAEAAQAASAAQIAQKAAEDAKTAAVAAQEKAEAAQAAAEEAEENAGENAAAAETARTAAETAKSLAEAAQEKAETAEDEAVKAKNAAEDAAKAAAQSDIKAAAEAAKAAVLAADAAKDAVRSAQSAEESAGHAAAAAQSASDAQAAQKAAEDAKAAAEAAKAAAEEEREAAENAKDDAETAQSAAEAAEKAAEAERIAAEAEKKAAEAAKQAAEAAQALAEAAQKAAEEGQLNAEAAKAAAEAAQAAAEAAKAAAEAEKLAAEEERKALEAAALNSAKYQAVVTIENLAEKICQTAYLAEIVADAKQAIDTAESTEEIQEILNQAKVDMDGIAELCPSVGFADVIGGAWYHDYVDYMIDNGYMKGMSDTEFGVNGSVTRGQLVTILYRTAGEPGVEGLENPFEDVQEGTYYYNAVIWAASEGIVKGMTETTFAPAAAISREQIVTILYRYAGEELVEEDYLAAYTDAETVSGYAVDAMNWAIANGVVNGMTRTTLAPTATATRGQICAIMQRFLEK